MAPPGWKDVNFDMSQEKGFFINANFKEVKVGVAPERIMSINQSVQAQRKQYGLRHRVTGTIHSAMGDTYESMASCISLADSNFGLWDKGQLIVIISRTREPQKTIFVGDKRDTLGAFKQLLLRRTQWTDYMEHILDVITINSNNDNDDMPTVVSPSTFPFRICDMSLPQCRTGYVYILSALRQREYVYVGMTKCLRSRINQHNSGYGSMSTEPSYLRPFAVLGYICGFDNNTDLQLHMERKWKDKINELKGLNVMDPRIWARSGQSIISVLDENRFGIEKCDLKLVLLFRDA